MPFSFSRLEIPEVVLVAAKAFPDIRGAFLETYKLSDFAAHGLTRQFVQDNFSWSCRGALRGLHYQKDPAAQGKLVFVAHGEIFDVAVDIRRGSPTFGRWVSRQLSADRRELLYVPEGFAHGFCVLSEQAGVFYKVTCEYAPACDRGIRWDDPDLAIDWPVRQPVLSPKDAAQPLLKDADINFTYQGQSH
jgi:dTDP-4-dehydrorhamnose 3,5-epimerase